MKLAITVCSTKKYSYALLAQARRVQAAINHLDHEKDEVTIILVTEKAETGDFGDKLKAKYNKILPWATFERIALDNVEDGHKNYKSQAQLFIAQMRSAAFERARTLDVDYCWSLDSDVLPRPNSFKCMKPMMEFDEGYYSIMTCPYPSQGGGPLLGGRGTIYKHICEDVYEDERTIPEEITARREKVRSDIDALNATEDKRSHEEKQKDFEQYNKELQAIDEEIKHCPPIGNIWVRSAKKWRLRGWLDEAYPAIGLGAVVPIDWCGFGCTMMNKRALSEAIFDGYRGGGTEDLYIVWTRWYPNGLKIGTIPHSPCDHIIRNPAKPGYYIHCQVYHETEGETKGHLRQNQVPWYAQEDGEKYDKENDGVLVRLPEVPEEGVQPIVVMKPVSANPVKTPESSPSNSK